MRSLLVSGCPNEHQVLVARGDCRGNLVPASGDDRMQVELLLAEITRGAGPDPHLASDDSWRRLG